MASGGVAHPEHTGMPDRDAWELISSLIGLLEAYLLFIILGSPGFPESLGEWIMINF